MKKIMIILLLITVTTLVYAQDFSEVITQGVFNLTPVELTEIEGFFNGVYLVQSKDNIPYTEVDIFDNRNLDSPYSSLKYYSYLNRTNETVTESIIEIYGQQFSLGRAVSENRDFAFDIAADHPGEMWYFRYDDKEYLCYVASLQRMINSRDKGMLLFDITDKENVQFIFLDTFNFSLEPQIGIRDDEPGLCILQSETYWGKEYNANRRTMLYVINNGQLEPVCNEKGKHIEAFWDWDKREYEYLLIYEDKNQNYAFEKMKKYKNNILVSESYSTHDDGVFDRVIQYTGK